ncbi:MAG: hypothetical protein V3V08_07180 [Nannocystaceae bacterium]
MDRLFAFSLEEQIACVEREIKLRGSVYKRRIAQKKMTRHLAEHEFNCMAAIRQTLIGLQATKHVINELENPLLDGQARYNADL